MIQNIKICNIYAPDKEDYDFLVGMLSKHPVNIFSEIPEEIDNTIPSIIVGCLITKEYFPEYNIFDKEIAPNLTWVYSSKEKNKEFSKQVNEFVLQTMKNWLPSDIILFDPFLGGSFDEFLDKNIKKDFISYAYFYQGGLYINNDNKNFVINLKTLSLIESKFKQKITSLLKEGNFLLFSHSNAAPYLTEEILSVRTLENICWIKFGSEIEDNVFFNIIPGYDIKKYIPFLMSGLPRFVLSQEEEKYLSRLQQKDSIVYWLSKRILCFDSSFLHDGLEFSNYEDKKFTSLSYSHKRTITGRIVCKDVYNIQNIQRESEDKKKIISRFKFGKILVCDYVSFESKIALHMSEDIEFIENYWNKDLHLVTAEIIFDSTNISADQRKLGKDINHAIMFGGGEELILKKISFLRDPLNILGRIKMFLRPILNKAFQINSFQKEYGYIIDDWGYIISPKKDFAAFNNYIQTTAAEILTDKLFEIKEFMKNKESQLLFPVHDSMVFDISPKENYLIQEIPKLLSNYKGKFFGISYKTGNNYKEMSEEKILI